MRIVTRFAVFSLLTFLLSWLALPPALAYNFLYVDKDSGDPLGWEPGTTINSKGSLPATQLAGKQLRSG